MSGPITVAGNWFEFFVAHYSQGQDGANVGGSLEFFWKPVGETSVTFPQFGNGPDNPDQFGHGGIVSARGFSVAIVEPESGATAMLLIDRPNRDCIPASKQLRTPAPLWACSFSL